MTERQLAAIVRGIMPVVMKELGALTTRLVAAETRMATLGDLRDRVVAVETKAASDITADLRERMGMVETRAAQPHPLEPALADVRERLAALERRVSDDVLSKDLAAVRERVAVLEVKAPVPGPPGADGKNGADGQDGLGFDDLTADFDGDRTLALKFSRDGRAKVFHMELPFLRYQGVFQHGKSYTVGDVVTFGNQSWHCHEATITPPGDGAKAWQLMVRKGRDGKDGKDGSPPAAPIVRVR